MSLDLARLPLALSARRREVPDGTSAPADGQPPMLPAEYVRLAVHVVEGGVPRHVVVEGSPTLGLPFGADLDVLLALFKLAQEDHQRVLHGQSPTIVDGEILAPTLRQIANAMGVTSNGDRPKRIRAALERLGRVRIRTTATLLRHEESRAARILAGERGTAPVVPDGRPARFGGPPVPGATGTGTPGVARPVMVEEEVTWLLEYRWRTDFSRNEDGEHWIARLRLNPLWLAHATSGWVAWVEMPVFVALGPLAKRLYMLLAGRAACEGLVTWEFGATELSHACAVGAGRAQGQVNRDLRLAAEDLRAAGVIANVDEARAGGELRFTFAPGPVLALAARLRGTGRSTPTTYVSSLPRSVVRRGRGAGAPLVGRAADGHARRDLLRRVPARNQPRFRQAELGAPAGRAHPESAHQRRGRRFRRLGQAPARGERGTGALACALRNGGCRGHTHRHEHQSTRCPRTPRVRCGDHGGAADRPRHHADVASRPRRDPAARHRRGTTDAARALWGQVRERASDGASLLVRSCLEAVSPVRVDGTELLVVAPDGRGEYVIQGAPRGLLLQHLLDVSDGAVTTLRLVRDVAPGAPAPPD